MKYISCIILASLILTSCKQNKNSTATTKNSNEVRDSVTHVSPAPVDVPQSETSGQKDEATGDTLMKFIVSFYSIGSGIDRGEPDKLKIFSETYGKKINVTILYAETHWGREGEVDFCFPLTGLTSTQVDDFKNGAKAVLKSALHVHFFENQACRKERPIRRN